MCQENLRTIEAHLEKANELIKPLLKQGYDKNTAILFVKLCELEESIYLLAGCVVDDEEPEVIDGEEWKQGK